MGRPVRSLRYPPSLHYVDLDGFVTNRGIPEAVVPLQVLDVIEEVDSNLLHPTAGTRVIM